MEHCIFCRIIAGEVPSSTVYEDENFKAIMDISPANKGHIIILPKEHSADLFGLSKELASKVLLVAKKIATALKAELGCEGINILQNNGSVAGQTVFHFHMHVIPRYPDDKVKMTWEHEKYQDGEAVALAEAISKRL